MSEKKEKSSFVDKNIDPIQYIQRVLLDIEDEIDAVSTQYNIDIKEVNNENYHILEEKLTKRNILLKMLDVVKSMFSKKKVEELVDEVKIESFDDLMIEFKTTLPRQTTTYEEKELVLSFIRRIQKSDASEEDKIYWKKQAIVVKGEINRLVGKRVRL